MASEENKENFNKKFINATKWSMLSELVYRSINPIVFLVLARLLTPQDYGMISVVTILLGFIQIINDFGFNKAIIQSNYPQKKLDNACSVVFWTNIIIGLVLFILVFLGADLIARLFGDDKITLVIRVMSIQIIFYSLISTQQAIIQRTLNFKLLFKVRLVTVLLPSLFTLPLAFMGFGYWALVAGSLTGSFVNALAIWIISDWKPRFLYDVTIIKELFNFSLWSTAESILGWLIGWGDAIIVGAYLSIFSMGLYVTGNNLVQIVIALVLSPILPVLFSSLSRLQDDAVNFKKFFLKAHKVVCMISFPMGMGLFLFSNIIEEIIFGDSWEGVGFVIGVLGLMNGLLFFIRLNGEGYRAKGRADLNTKIMLINLVLYSIVYLTTIRYGLHVFLIFRAVVSFVQIPYHFKFSKKIFSISLKDAIINVKYIGIGTLSMLIAGTFFNNIMPNGLFYSILSAIICCFVYLIFILPELKIIKNIIPNK